eukprot:s6_g23.t1
MPSAACHEAAPPPPQQKKHRDCDDREMRCRCVKMPLSTPTQHFIWLASCCWSLFLQPKRLRLCDILESSEYNFNLAQARCISASKPRLRDVLLGQTLAHAAVIRVAVVSPLKFVGCCHALA